MDRMSGLVAPSQSARSDLYFANPVWVAGLGQQVVPRFKLKELTPIRSLFSNVLLMQSTSRDLVEMQIDVTHLAPVFNIDEELTLVPNDLVWLKAEPS